MATDVRFFQRLRSILKRPSIRYMIPGDRPSTAFQQRLHNQFLLSSRNLYQQSLAGSTERYARVRDYELQDTTCIDRQTKIATPSGFETIEELSKKYKNGEKFIVYAYDYDKQKLVPAYAHDARKTRTDHTYKIIFDNDSYLVATANHPIMLRDGTYKRVDELKENDSCMPFYRKEFYKNNPYQFVYTTNIEDGKRGWTPEHRYVAECFYRKVEIDECVHHKDFNPTNNDPSNLLIMKKSDHKKYHMEILNQKTWADPEIRTSRIANIKKASILRWSDPEERKRFGEMRTGKNNSLYHKTYEEIYGEERAKEMKLKRSLSSKGRKFGPQTWEEKLAHSISNLKAWEIKRQNGTAKMSNIGKINVAIGTQKAMQKPEIKLKLLLGIKNGGRKLRVEKQLELQQLQEKLNHKVKSVEYYGIEDVYDLTVDGYENFATDTVIVHNSPICSLALNTFADNASQIDEKGLIVGIRTEFDKIKNELEILYYDILNVDFNAWHWLRNMTKYGDMFLLMDVFKNDGITSYISLPTIEIEREEGFDNDVNSVRFKWTYNNGAVYENFQIAHFRIKGDDTFLPYGRAILEPARRPWKQYNLIIDAMLSYRIARAPERRVFYIDIGNISPNEITGFMQRVRDQLKRQPLMDQGTGQMDLRYNAVPLDDDYFIPVRGESKTRIDTLPGAQNLGDIADVQLIRSELISALGIPSIYVDDHELGAGRTLGAQQDLQFARSVQRIQKAFLSELTKIGIIHLYAKGYDPEQIKSFSLTMTPPSAILEMQKLEVFDKRFTIYSNAIRDKGVSRRWGQKYILNLANDEISLVNKEVESDSRLIQKLNTIESGAAAQGAMGGAGAEMLPPATGEKSPLAVPEPGTMTDASIGTELVDKSNDKSLVKKKKQDYLTKAISESVQSEKEVRDVVENLKNNLKKKNGTE